MRPAASCDAFATPALPLWHCCDVSGGTFAAAWMPSASKECAVANDRQPSATGMIPGERARAAAMTRTGQPVALFAVKTVHTVIFFSMSWAVLYTLYSGLTNRMSCKTGMAVAAVVGEGIVFASNGWRCPLTKVAEGLGAANGTVADIFLPQWFARRIPAVSSTLMGVGLLAMLWHRLAADRVVRDEEAVQ